MLQIVLVVLPVFLLIFVGWLCRWQAFPGDGFWAPAERLTYFLLFPVLLVTTLAKADFASLQILPMAGAISVAILVMTGLTLLLRMRLRIPGPTFTSVFQGSVRMNTYIGLSVAFGIYAEQGLAAAALAVAAIMPLANVLCVLVLARYGKGAQPSLIGVLRQLAGNPLILACIVGGCLNLLGLGLPPVVGPMMEILSRAALPLGLLAVGAALDFRAARASSQLVLITAGLKLIVLPVLTLGALFALGVGGVAAFVAVLFNGLPTATSAYILARQLGGDAALMASLITVQTFLSMLSLPLVLALVPGT
jgi:predicted permease